MKNEDIVQKKNHLSLIYMKLKLDELKDKCRKLNLKITGNKQDLVNRIISVEVTDDNIQDLIYSTTQSFTSKINFQPTNFMRIILILLMYLIENFMRKNAMIK